MTSQSC